MSLPVPRGVLQPLPPPSPDRAQLWAESRRPLVERLRDEILGGGPITFARFMELALYDPQDGYYAARPDEPERGPRTGREGDFLTAPEMDPLFGQVLAGQLEECWERLDRPSAFTFCDDGAGTGALGLAVLDELQRRSAPILHALRYLPLEADPTREADARERLAAAGHGSRLLPQAARVDPLQGVLVANELLDALPVHRLERRDGHDLEIRVAWRDGWFAEAPGPPSDPRLFETLDASGVHLEDGQRAEVSLAALDWVAALPARLARGYAVLIDYGGPAATLYGGRHPEGLLRTYRAHHAGDDPFRAVGEQDLTAHVDTSALERVARATGLEVLGRTSQAEAMAGLDAGEALVELGRRRDTDAARYRAARGALLRLLDPAAMGGFQVLVLGRHVPLEPPLRALAYRLPRDTATDARDA